MATEEEKQRLMNEVVDICDNLIEQYDWDAEWIKYQDGRGDVG